MKKLLTVAVGITMSATCIFALSACNNKKEDAKTAKDAIYAVRVLYENQDKETPVDYQVLGKTKVGDKLYDIDWTVAPAATCTVENFSNYVSVGAIDDENLITVSINTATVAIDYTLKASVTVGKATESIEFEHTVPAGTDWTDKNVKKAKIDFTDAANRTSQDNSKQVWKQNDATLTNEKASSSTNVANYSNPVRFYQGSSVKIEFPGILQITFTSEANYDDNPYIDRLKESLEASLSGATITTDLEAKTLTLELATPVDELVFTATKQLRLYSMDIVGQVGGATDAQKVAAAKAALDLDTKNYVLAGTYDLPATQNGATVTWAVKDTSDYVSIDDNGKLSISSMPAEETEVTLTATLSSGTESDTKDLTITLKPIEGVTHAGTEADPFTTAEAKLVAKETLAAGETSKLLVYVKGYVILKGTYSDQYKNFDNMYIADSADADKDDAAALFYIFRPSPDGTYLTTDGFYRGDEVTFKGYLQNYKDSNTQELIQELVSGTCVARTPVEKTDAEFVAEAKEEVDLTKKRFVTLDEELTLPATKGDAALSWRVKTETTVVEIAEGKLTIKSLPEEVATITLEVTITYGDASDTKDITITVVKPTPFAAGTYQLALVQAKINNGTKLYFTGKLSGSYYATSANPLDAADVVVEAVEGGYTLKTGETYLALETRTSGSKTYVDCKLVAEAKVWAYNYDLEVFTFAINDDTYYLGTYGTYNTISASATSYISGANASKVGVEQFPAKFEKFDFSALTDAEKVALELDKVSATLANITEEGEVTLDTPVKEDVTFTWSVKEDESLPAGVTLAEGKLTVSALPAEDTEVILVVTATCGDVSEDNTKEVKVVIKAAKVGNAPTPLTFGSGVNADTEKTNQYTGKYNAVRGDMTYTIAGFSNNNNAWSNIRTGHKSNDIKATITTGQVAAKVTKVVVTIDSIVDSYVEKVNSFKLKVYKDAECTDLWTEVSCTIAAGDITFTIDAEKQGANYYYQIEIDCEKSGGNSNGLIQLSKVELFVQEDAE